MEIDRIKSIYFLGIGGIGMSALARYFHSRGVHVCGYDRTATVITDALIAEGIDIGFDDHPGQVRTMPELLIYTPAIPENSRLFRFFRASGIPMKKRAEVLGILSQTLPVIAVAGTHGKTTICSMLTHIMKEAGIPCLSFLGGISVNYNTNYLSDPQPVWMITEADEYDRSFLQLTTRITLISAIDSDHLDVYGNRREMLRSFYDFALKASHSGTLITKNTIAQELGVPGNHLNYRIHPPADYHLEHIRLINGRFHAEIRGRLNTGEFCLQHPGKHNLENALAASALAHLAGAGTEDILKGINSFAGVKRRFEIVLQTDQVVYVDDYAHHPEEISACIRSAKELWPDMKTTGIFQPHLFSRTRDLADEFASSLSLLDELIMLDIYPAREKPIEGVDARTIMDKVKHTRCNLLSKEAMLSHLKNSHTELVISMGAGDIGELTGGIKEILTNKEV